MKEVVISISDQLYENIKKSKACGKHGVVGCDLLDAVADGVVLPEGHGRLVDADEIQFEREEFETYGDYCIAFDAIDNAITILEEDVGDK